MIVCVCHRISHRDIERQAMACASFDDLQMSTGVATSCGRCTDCAQTMFQAAQQNTSCGARMIRIDTSQPLAA